MGTERRLSLGRMLLVVGGSVIIAWAFGTLAEHLGWRIFSEAGGQIVRSAF